MGKKEKETFVIVLPPTGLLVDMYEHHLEVGVMVPSGTKFLRAAKHFETADEARTFMIDQLHSGPRKYASRVISSLSDEAKGFDGERDTRSGRDW